MGLGNYSRIIMKKIIMALAAVAMAACSGPAFDPAAVADATAQQVTRVEPLSWWVGMKTDLQLLVQGENISEYDVAVEGGAVVTAVLGNTPGAVDADVGLQQVRTGVNGGSDGEG